MKKKYIYWAIFLNKGKVAVTNKFGGGLMLPCVSFSKQDPKFEQFYIKINELILAPFEVISPWSFETAERVDVYCHCEFFDNIGEAEWEDVEWMNLFEYINSAPMSSTDPVVLKHLFNLI